MREARRDHLFSLTPGFPGKYRTEGLRQVSADAGCEVPEPARASMWRADEVAQRARQAGASHWPGSSAVSVTAPIASATSLAQLGVITCDLALDADAVRARPCEAYAVTHAGARVCWPSRAASTKRCHGPEETFLNKTIPSRCGSARAG